MMSHSVITEKSLFFLSLLQTMMDGTVISKGRLAVEELFNSSFSPEHDLYLHVPFTFAWELTSTCSLP